ncbi:MAG: leucyl aminopeptidase family protein [Alphaproteobacteria bacterium]|nr:leucyl aminopeptidase family protein [Alphaproteobacteria bacterium]
MLDCFAPRPSPETVPVVPVGAADLKKRLEAGSTRTVAWLESTGFKAKAGQIALLPGRNGRLARVFVGTDGGAGAEDSLWALADLPSRLPAGRYALDAKYDRRQATRAALGWALGHYAFGRYRKRERKPIDLVWPRAADRDHVVHVAEAVYLVRDLINTPAADLGPAELADAAKALARRHRAQCSVIVGDALLKRDYPMIHAVGKGSARAPRLIDISWGPARAPRVTLVGKGVCFDSGGYDLKPSAGMKLMKKDMGGAAHALGLASLIMASKLRLRLRVLIPAVENMVSGTAFRPLDVLRTRKGLTVEIGNTDAEGRLILADALAEADRDKPELLVDFATLTGAARVALGPDLPALFTDHDDLADDLLRHGRDEADPMWRLPLWRPYRPGLDSKVADLNNISDSSFAGAITAALFLKEFVADTTRWAHFDLYAWNGRARPGRPEGGEAMALRAVYALIRERFGR